MERGQVPASLNSCTFTICCLVGWRWNTATSPTPRLLMYTHCLDTDNNVEAQIYHLGSISLDLSSRIDQLGSISLDRSAWIYQSPVGVDEDLGGGSLVDADHGELRHLAQVPGLDVQVEQLDQSEISVQVT